MGAKLFSFIRSRLLLAVTFVVCGFFIAGSIFATIGGVIPTFGGESISADTNSTTGSGAWTSLIGPYFTETATGQIGGAAFPRGDNENFIYLNAPAGFEFDDSSPINVLVTNTGSPTQTDYFNDLPSGSLIPVTVVDGEGTACNHGPKTRIKLIMTGRTANGALATLEWKGVKVRPTGATGNGKITICSSRVGITSVDGSATGTSFGLLNEVIGKTARAIITASKTTISAVADSTTLTISNISDISGNLVTGPALDLQAKDSLGNSLGTLSNCSTVTAGQETCTFSSTKPGTVILSVSGVTLTGDTSIVINAGPISIANSTISATPTSVEADSVSVSTITVTAKDANNNLLSGKTVVLSVLPNTDNILTQPSVPTDENGVAVGTLASTKPASKTVSASIDGTKITGTISIDFISGSPVSATLTANPKTFANNNGHSTITISNIIDEFGNAMVTGPVLDLKSDLDGTTISECTSILNSTATCKLTSTKTGTTNLSITGLQINEGSDTSVAITPGWTTHYVLEANPSTVTYPNTTEIKVTAKDINENTNTNENTASVFILADNGGVLADNPVTFTGGVATTTLSRNDDSNGSVHISISSTMPSNSIVVIFSKSNDVPPVISSHADVIAEATSAQGATVSYILPTASDDVDGSVFVSCKNASGLLFPIGETTITCTAKDSQGNTATSSFKIIVQDTTAPVISLTGASTQKIVLEVEYAELGASATDAVDGTDEVVIDSKSVDTKTAGSYTVTYTATDSANNVSTKTRTVEVVDPKTFAIEAPADITQKIGEGDTAITTIADLGTPTILNAIDDKATLINDAPVDGFPAGETIVTWTATDGDLTATATQKINIIPTTLHLDGAPQMQKFIATPGGDFDQGWQWVFNITVPDDKTQLSLSFDDWANSATTDKIPVYDDTNSEGNVRFYSLQSQDNKVATSAKIISGSKTAIMAKSTGIEQSPDIITVSDDLDANTLGKQIQVTVDAKIPAAVVQGSYFTNYDIQASKPDAGVCRLGLGLCKVNPL